MSTNNELRLMTKDFAKKYQQTKAEEFTTKTIEEQIKTENLINICFQVFSKRYGKDADLSLFKEQHVKYLIKGLGSLPSGFECLDASRPWICYWITHALYLLDVSLNREMKRKLVDFLNRCQSPTGGFGGGPGQQAHLATTYASINALCTLDIEEAYSLIDRQKLLEWLLRIQNKNGSMCMHEDGEEDLRGVYCAIVIAKLTNLEPLCPKLFNGCAEWIASCQTYEGGFGAVPESEAHGGYTFCGVAALKLLHCENLMDIDRLLKWLVNKQMKFEGGFQGRTNKLVDSCYSFWQAGQFPILHSILMTKSEYLQETNEWLFDQDALQEYILICCQAKYGGLIDKPGKNRDFYHSCYALSGLSISQYYSDQIFNITNDEDDLINVTHPLYNISPKAVQSAMAYFSIE